MGIKNYAVEQTGTLELLDTNDEPMLGDKGLVNYWGYNTLGFFSPDPRYAREPGNPAAVNDEFRCGDHLEVRRMGTDV